MTGAAPTHRPQDGEASALALSDAQSLLFDALRLLAAQAVLLGHSFDFFDWNSSLHDPTHPQIQRLAVTVFFVLSGFLIPWTVGRRKVLPSPVRSLFANYFLARSTRIYAGLVPALVFIAVIDALPANRFESDYPPVPGAGTFFTWTANLLHLQEFPGTSIPIFGTGDPLWSLAVEWWIYILFGLLVLRPRGAWLILWVPALASVAWNSIGGTGDGIALAWFLGWGAYIGWRKLRPKTVSGTVRASLGLIGMLAFAVGCWSAATWGERSHFALDLPFALCFTTAMLMWLLALERRPSTERKRQGRSTSKSAFASWVRAGAGVSFTLYLTHFSILSLFYEARDQLDPARLVAFAFVASNVTAWTLSWCGERHTGRLRSRMEARLSR